MSGHAPVHRPFTDDGVTYCGWDGHEGCGEVWPCTAMKTPAEYFEARQEQDGTHYEGCWKSHPDCAYWRGRRDGWNRACTALRDQDSPLDRNGNT